MLGTTLSVDSQAQGDKQKRLLEGGPWEAVIADKKPPSLQCYMGAGKHTRNALPAETGGYWNSAAN